MKRIRQWFIFILLIVLSLSAIAITCAAWLLSRSLPELETELTLRGLERSADVEFDEFGIPRIYAQIRNDAYRILGFVTARDRLFQMDLLRRRSAGRLSEILGPALLDSDRWNRTMGYEKLAGEILIALPEDQQAVLRAYSQGVNQAITSMRALPFEFVLLRFEPEPWREEDSLLVILGMHAMLTWVDDQEYTVL
jgi:penicillin amidase